MRFVAPSSYEPYNPDPARRHFELKIGSPITPALHSNFGLTV